MRKYIMFLNAPRARQHSRAVHISNPRAYLAPRRKAQIDTISRRALGSRVNRLKIIRFPPTCADEKKEKKKKKNESAPRIIVLHYPGIFTIAILGFCELVLHVLLFRVVNIKLQRVIEYALAVSNPRVFPYKQTIAPRCMRKELSYYVRGSLFHLCSGLFPLFVQVFLFRCSCN